jgi:hypothetical protein
MTTSGTTSRKGSRRRSQRGASFIEGSFVLLITISLIVFMMDIGRFLLTQQYISEKARTAARLAVVNNWHDTEIQNYFCYGSTTAPAGNPTPPGLMGLTTSNVAPVWKGTAGSPDRRLQITVSGLRIFTWVPMMSNTLSTIPVIATAASQSLGAAN